MNIDRYTASVRPRRSGRIVLLPILIFAMLLLGSILIYWCFLLDRTSKPNFIFIAVDSLRYDHLGCYGYPQNTSPNIDRFAKDATLFEDFISQSPWTLPSHATMFFGLNSGAHGVDHNFERIAPDAVTLPLILQQNGYETIGLACAPLLETPYGFQRGFDLYDDLISSKTKNKSWRNVTSKKVVQKAIQSLKRRQKKNFFLFLHMWDVHYDYNPPQPWDKKFFPEYEGDLDPYHWVRNDKVKEYISEEDKKFIISQYDGEISFTDHHLGLFFREIKKMGLWENTVIIITADHGEEFFDHGGTCHSLTLYDELVHVPFIIRIPDLHGPPKINCRSAMVDLYPTILELAEIPAPEKAHLQGQSLIPLIEGTGQCDPEREILTETVWSLHHGLTEGTPKGYEVGMYKGRYKISRRLNSPLADYLFDLENDPLEKNNLARTQPELFRQLSGRLKERSLENSRIHDQVNFSRHKMMNKKTVDTLEALGYVE